MATKPTFEELEQRVKQLEKELTDREYLKETLRENVSMFESILEKAAAGICVCHNLPEEPYTRFTHWNPQMPVIVGYTMEEINKLGWYQTMYPDPETQKRAIERMARMREGEHIKAEEWVITTKDGEKRPVSISTSIIKEEDGKVHVLAVMQNISERKRAEEALRESEEKYRNLIEKSDDIIWTADLDLRTIYVSSSIIKKLGFTPEERMEQDLDVQVTPSSYARIIERLSQELKREQEEDADPNRIIRVEVEYYHKNGSILWFENIASGLRDENGLLTGLQGVSRDITGRKRAEEALRESERELKNKARDLEELNAALKVLLNKRQGDKEELEEAILSNLRTLIEPYMVKLKGSELPQSQKTLLNILESNLNELVSPFTRKLSSQYLNLTPTQIQVANLVKQGKTNKDISEILHVTGRTIAFHRENIRKKLGLTNKKTNLKTYLMSID